MKARSQAHVLSKMKNVTPEQIDELLPQTQCGLCGYGGCMPYAEAMAFEKAPINLCPPGGVKTLHNLGQLLEQDPVPFVAEMKAKEKPKMLAVIREAECIGCTKCIQACPVDAILGSAKQMHSVIAAECTGCELCVSPCPVDCIDMIVIANESSDTQADLARQRFRAREKRLSIDKFAKKQLETDKSLTTKRNYIQEAIARAKAKKSGSNS
jgi:electron transport complex protein RnfB